MKSSTMTSMAIAMLASFSAAMPAPLGSDSNVSQADRKGGVTLHARQDTAPRCSVPCIQNAIAKVTDCDFTDVACACKHHGKVSAAAQACVVGSCGLQRAVKVVVPAVRKMCAKEAEKEVKEEEEEKEEEEKGEEVDEEIEEGEEEGEKDKRDLEVVQVEEDDDDDDDDEDEDEDEDEDDEAEEEE